jgi:hypothetical protein
VVDGGGAISAEEYPLGSAVSAAARRHGGVGVGAVVDLAGGGDPETDTAPSRIAFWLGHWPVGVLGLPV